MDWEQLRHFGALARAGTLAGAARSLGVEHTTVARRVQALEKALGKSLFARGADGHQLTEAGRQLLPAIEAMTQAARQLEHAAELAVDDAEAPSGLVRVGTTEGLGTQLLAPALARLTLQWPQLSVDLLALPRLLHLSRREADIVISLERPGIPRFPISMCSGFCCFPKCAGTRPRLCTFRWICATPMVWPCWP